MLTVGDTFPVVPPAGRRSASRRARSSRRSRTQRTRASGRSSSSGRWTSRSSARPRSPSSASATATSRTATPRCSAPAPTRSSSTSPGARTTRTCKNLPFPMLADTKRELSQALGILHKQDGVPLRATFIVDPEGVIRCVERQRPLGRPQRGRGAARARRAADRRALPLQLEEGRADPGGGVDERARRRSATALPEAAQGHQAEPADRAAGRRALPGAAVGRGGRLGDRRPQRRAARRARRATRRAEVGAAVLDDALAAAALMAMNNVYYRFRHLVGKPTYGDEAGAPAHEPPGEAGHEQGSTSSCSAWPCQRDQRLRDLHPGRTRRPCSRAASPRTTCTTPSASPRSYTRRHGAGRGVRPAARTRERAGVVGVPTGARRAASRAGRGPSCRRAARPPCRP